MGLGTTKELDTVGEDAFDCAGSLQSMISFRSTWLAKTSFTAVTKSYSAIKSFLRFVSAMTPPSMLLPPLPNTSSSCPLPALHTFRIAFRPLWNDRIHRLSSPNDLIASIQLDLYCTPSLQRSNSRPDASFSMQYPILNTIFRRRFKQFEKVRRGQVGYEC